MKELNSYKRSLVGAIALLIYLLLCLQLTACNAISGHEEEISVTALAQQIEQARAPLILDVRSPTEYAAGHIPNAVNLPYREITNQLESLHQLERKSDTHRIIVYCERGVRAGIAANRLSAAGFSSVIQLTGDMPAWRDAHLPISTGR